MEVGTMEVEDSGREFIAERRLWTAVIIYAVQDWLSGSIRQQREAQQFLFDENKDFREVCACAGLDPSSLRGKLLRVGRRVDMRGPLAHPAAA